MEPVGRPPNHAISNLVVVSDVTKISKGRTNLLPEEPHSSPNKEDNESLISFPFLFNSCEGSNNEDEASSLPKSKVIFHLPGAQGEDDVSWEDIDDDASC